MSHPLDQYIKPDLSIDATRITCSENTDAMFQPKARDMTLRDHFAAAALTLAAAGASHVMNPRELTPAQVREIVAGEAYKLADAMLAERAK